MSDLSTQRDAEHKEQVRQKQLDSQIPARIQVLITVGAVVIGLLANFVFAKAELAGLFWLVASACGAMLLVHVRPMRYWVGTKRGVFIFFATIALFALGWFGFLADQRDKQHAALISGVLTATHAGWTRNGNRLFWRPFASEFGLIGSEDKIGGEFNVGHNNQVKVYRKDGKVYVSTTVRDRFDNLIVQIEDNHWKVGPNCWDKNYTDDTLEVIDARGRVVLQVRVLDNGIILDGEWPEDDGAGPAVFTSGRNRYSKQNGFTKLFKYPSSEHWGEYADGEGPTLNEQ